MTLLVVSVRTTTATVISNGQDMQQVSTSLQRFDRRLVLSVRTIGTSPKLCLIQSWTRSYPPPPRLAVGNELNAAVSVSTNTSSDLLSRRLPGLLY